MCRRANVRMGIILFNIERFSQHLFLSIRTFAHPQIRTLTGNEFCNSQN
jgi:hypothetical protein